MVAIMLNHYLLLLGDKLKGKKYSLTKVNMCCQTRLNAPLHPSSTT